MALIDDIRTTLRTVVGSTTGLGETWSYRAITSAPTVQTLPTFATWADTTGLKSGDHIADIPDPRTGKLTRRSRAFLRVPDSIVLANGSQVSIDRTTIWSVDELASAGAGTLRYLIGRELTERGQSNRGGGV